MNGVSHFWKTTSKGRKVIHKKCILFTANIAAKYALNTTSRSLECWKGSNYHEKHIHRSNTLQDTIMIFAVDFDLCPGAYFTFLMSMGITSLTRTAHSYRREYRTLSISWLQDVHVRRVVVPSCVGVVRRETTVDLDVYAKIPLT